MIQAQDDFYAIEKPVELDSYEQFTKGLRTIFQGDNSEIKTKIIQKLINRIEIGKNLVRIHYLVGKSSIREICKPLSAGSNSLTNGAQDERAFVASSLIIINHTRST